MACGKKEGEKRELITELTLLGAKLGLEKEGRECLLSFKLLVPGLFYWAHSTTV